MADKTNILIIGGGWSGLAAAITLTQQGHSIHLVESAKQLGGRARNVQWHNQTVDNGQHLMIGAYIQMLAIMNTIGIDANKVFNRLPMDISIYDNHYAPLNLSANHRFLPWPLSLAWNLIDSAGIKGLFQVVRVQHSIPSLLSHNDITVSNWLLKNKQSAQLITQLWEPLCLATLNTPINRASAHLFATVLRDSLGGGKSAADLLIPRQPLGKLFPQAAAHYIEQYGSKISLQTRVKDILIENKKVTGVRLQNGVRWEADTVIVATSPSQTTDLLAQYIHIDKPTEYPICTVYLQYPSHTRLPKPMLGMTGTLSQWVFDRSEQSPGLIAIVISGPGKHELMSKDELVQYVAAEIHQLLPDFPTIKESFVIREKRATFACTVDIEKKRPASKTDIEGLWLVGDYIANTYPATLEGAIRNGQNCAQHILSP